MTTAPLTFSTDPKVLGSQLMECDDASIAGHMSSPDLEHHFGVDAVRKLSFWDTTGDLSAIAYPILQSIGMQEIMTFDSMSVPRRSMEYLGVLCSEADNNRTWHDKYANIGWTRYHEQREYRTRTMSHHFWCREFGDQNEQSIVTIPFYAEGFNSYLCVYIYPTP